MHVVRTGTLLALTNLVLNLFPLIERGVTGDLDLRMVDEQVFAAINWRDKSVALVGVKPLYCSLCHCLYWGLVHRTRRSEPTGGNQGSQRGNEVVPVRCVRS